MSHVADEDSLIFASAEERILPTSVSRGLHTLVVGRDAFDAEIAVLMQPGTLTIWERDAEKVRPFDPELGKLYDGIASAIRKAQGHVRKARER